MSEPFIIIDKLKEYQLKIRINIQKINKKISKLNLTDANGDDFEKIADYFDEIKSVSNRAIVKLDELIDDNSNSSDSLDTLDTLSIDSYN